MSISPLESASYWALDPPEQRAVTEFVKLHESHGAPLPLDMPAIYRRRWTLAQAIVDAERVMDATNPATFQFLSCTQKEMLRGELFLIFYQLSADYRLAVVEQDALLSDRRAKQLKTCARLINQLRPSDLSHADAELAMAIDASSHCTRYLGVRLVVPRLLAVMNAVSSGHAAQLHASLDAINERRQYWVWASAMIGELLTALPQSLADVSLASSVLDHIRPVTGAMSWIVYFARGGMAWSQLASHTVTFAMSRAERDMNIPWDERFSTQWRIRKGVIINDSIWGLANLACYFVLCGSGVAGYWGNALTGVLLLMDVTLSYYGWREAETEHQANLARYAQTIATLEHRKTRPQVSASQRRHWDSMIARVSAARGQSVLDWKYKQHELSINAMHAVTLLVSFSLACCFFFPPAALAPASVFLLGVVGLSLCFLFSLIRATLLSSMHAAKFNEKVQGREPLIHQELMLFINKAQAWEQAASRVDLTPLARGRMSDDLKHRYLMLKESYQTTRFERSCLCHQQFQLYSSTLRDALLPPLYIAALVFMPMGVGIGVLAAGLVLAFSLHLFLRYSAPSPQALPVFDEGSYTQFLAHAQHADTQAMDRMMREPVRRPCLSRALFFPLFDPPTAVDRFSPAPQADGSM